MCVQHWFFEARTLVTWIQMPVRMESAQTWQEWGFHLVKKHPWIETWRMRGSSGSWIAFHCGWEKGSIVMSIGTTGHKCTQMLHTCTMTLKPVDISHLLRPPWAPWYERKPNFYTLQYAECRILLGQSWSCAIKPAYIYTIWLFNIAMENHHA